jgi:hypothetical protein
MHPSLKEEDVGQEFLSQLATHLFPGIEISIPGKMEELQAEYLAPALRLQFPEYSRLHAGAVREEDVELHPLLPCNGREWLESDAWRAKFAALVGKQPRTMAR